MISVLHFSAILDQVHAICDYRGPCGACRRAAHHLLDAMLAEGL